MQKSGQLKGLSDDEALEAVLEATENLLMNLKNEGVPKETEVKGFKGGKDIKELSEQEIREIWYNHEAENLDFKLTREETDFINEFVRNSGDDNLWEYDE